MSDEEDVSAADMAALMVGVKRKAQEGLERSAKRSKRDKKKQDEKPAQAAPAQRSLEELYGGEPPELQFKLLQERKIWLSMKDLQGLVLWVVGKDDAQMPPRWVFVRHKPLIKNVVVVCLNSMSLPLWSKYGKECMPWLAGDKPTEEVDEKAPATGTAAPAPWHKPPPPQKLFDTFHTRLNTSKADVKKNSFLAELFQKDVPKKKPQGSGFPKPRGRVMTGVGAAMALFKQGDGAPASPAPAEGPRESSTSSPHPPPQPNEVPIPDIPVANAVSVMEKMRATEVELAEHGFSITVEEEGWARSRAAEGELCPEQRVLCIDCEMCLTKVGHELARVTVLDWAGAVVWDQLCLPDHPIENYLTEYSGITAATLQDVTTTLKDVQATLLSKFLFQEVVLIGHSLENDLKALKVVHLNVCDTTILYPHFQGPPLKRALRHISERFLGRVIQDHTRRAGSGIGHCPVEDAKAALDLVKMKVHHGENFGVPPKQRFEPMMRHIEGKCLVYDEPDLIPNIPARDSRADIVPVATDKEAFKKSTKQVRSGKYPFTFVHLHSLEQYMDATEWGGLEEQDAEQEVLLKDVMASTDEGLRKLYSAAPPHTAFFVMSGQVNGVSEQEEQEEQDELAAVEAQLRKWDQARHGMLWLGLKGKAPDTTPSA
eukprot:TRINITY_DN29998_c0_g1_i1.p1 TRINITY_DN29998_c0_g1~~TRINITY_DN29998_c0_g1_i1.p1  ORF type:complete len:656 (+),score=255.85 TRINITY_DN29998_c0_g1_i1:63-2030(+)